jgi:hypothetical protein
VVRTPIPPERYAAGLDLGGDKPGGDPTVLTVARLAGEAVEVLAHQVWRGAPFPVVEAGVIEAARRWGLAKLCVDATGMGGPVAVRLEGALGHTVEPVTFNEGVKSELGFALLAEAGAGRVRLYGDGDGEAPACWDDLRACRAEVTPAGKLRWGNLRGHDDFTVSLALCVRAASLAGRPRVAVGRRR